MDVKKLKRRLWNHLQDTVAAPGKEDDDNMNDEDAMEADSEKDEEEKRQAASFI